MIYHFLSALIGCEFSRLYHSGGLLKRAANRFKQRDRPATAAFSDSVPPGIGS